MTLSSADIDAIASAVVRKLSTINDLMMDADYSATLPIEEIKQIQRAKRRGYEAVDAELARARGGSR
jgi:hypothetical protein